MQIFFDTGAKFHEFPLMCGIAEESLIYDNLLVTVVELKIKFWLDISDAQDQKCRTSCVVA